MNLAQQHAKCGGAVTRQRLKGKRGRTIDLDAGTVAALRAWRKRQAAERLAWPGEWGNAEGLVFTHEDGTPLHPDSITKLLKRRVAAAGLPWIKLHGLRHSHASLMLAAGVPLKVVQEPVGARLDRDHVRRVLARRARDAGGGRCPCGRARGRLVSIL